MKKFKFPLAKLLEVRKEKEKEAQKHLHEAHLFWLDQLKDLEVLEQRCTHEQQLIVHQQKESMEAEKLSSHYAYLNLIHEKLVLQKEQVQRALTHVDEQRQKVVVAMQQRKIIENLFEKKLREWDLSYNEGERAFFDELAMLRYNFEKRK